WRRMAYFGGALSHSALLGVALGVMLSINLTLAILVFCLLLAALLVLLEHQRLLANDTLLGILAHATLALGLVAVAFMENTRVDLMAYLFGDILAVDRDDLILIWVLSLGSLIGLGLLWRPLLAITVNEELAAVEGISVGRVKLVFVLLIAAVIAVGMKIVGILLIISLLIIPPAAARRLSNTPEQMALGASLVGVISVLLGLYGSLQWDLPSGPAIVVAATLLFSVSLLLPRRS
ncbi:MAG: metal ABC transporter permease, partial [Chromatiales bacterium]|nr:metal ABC transporter permease [Chromatiales bacterium]